MTKERRIAEVNQECSWNVQGLLYDFGLNIKNAYDERDAKIRAIEEEA